MTCHGTSAAFKRLRDADGAGVSERLATVNGQRLNAVGNKPTIGEKDVIGRYFDRLTFICEENPKMRECGHNAA
jgi:hypothetical protein